MSVVSIPCALVTNVNVSGYRATIFLITSTCSKAILTASLYWDSHSAYATQNFKKNDSDIISVKRMINMYEMFSRVHMMWMDRCPLIWSTKRFGCVIV